MREQQNRASVRPAYILVPQASCPIPAGEAGQWLDKSDSTIKTRNADGTDTAGGGGANTWKESCRLATAAALGAGVYDDVALTFTQSSAATEQIDGKTVAVGDRVLIKDQVDATQNGIYTVTVKGTGSVKQVLTRAPDCDASSMFEPAFVVPIAEGTANADSAFQFTQDAPFVMDTDDATFSLMPISITYATTAEIADLDSTAEGAGVSDTVARGDHKHAVVNLTGASVANVANVNTVGGVAEIFRTAIPSGANGDVDITLAAGHKIRVLEAGVVLKGAGTAGSLVTLKSTATAISNAIDVSGGGDKAVFRASTIDDASFEIAGGGILRWSKASTGADFPGAEAWVLAVRVA